MEFCSRYGIRRELIPAHNPQQNGVVETKNISIVGVARAMLHDKGFPLYLWEEACNTTISLQNKTPHKILVMITPEEAFPRRKQDVSHFLIFGATMYCHVSKDMKKKLEPTNEMGVFVGYT